MANSAKTVGRVTQVGNSLGTVIDKNTAGVLNLDKGMLVQLSIEKQGHDPTHITSRVTNIGKSKGVIIDKNAAELLDLQVGDLLQLTIKIFDE